MKQLHRLKVLREGRERLGEASVVVEMAKLRAAEDRLAAAIEAAAKEAREARRAVEAGERPAWMLSLALQEAEQMQRPRLEAACREREAAVKAAQRLLHVCRIETEQASVLERGVREAMSAEDARRTQAESDDRYAGRGHWLKRVRFLTDNGK